VASSRGGGGHFGRPSSHIRAKKAERLTIELWQNAKLIPNLCQIYAKFMPNYAIFMPEGPVEPKMPDFGRKG